MDQQVEFLPCGNPLLEAPEQVAIVAPKASRLPAWPPAKSAPQTPAKSAPATLAVAKAKTPPPSLPASLAGVNSDQSISSAAKDAASCEGE